MSTFQCAVCGADVKLTEPESICSHCGETFHALPPLPSEVRATIVRHSKGQVCPRCRAPAFCDDCGICEACSFATPDVAITQPPAPLPKLRCTECGGASSHERTCSVSVRATLRFPPLPSEVRATIPAPRAPRILANRAQCLTCGDVIESTHVHEFRTCKCGGVSVDGGHEYLRRLWKGGEPEASYIELSFREGEPEPRPVLTIGVPS